MIVIVNFQVCQVNASVGVYTTSTFVIEVTVPVYRQVCQFNAVVGVHM